MIRWLHTEMFAYKENKIGCCIMLLLVVIMSIHLFVITGCNEPGNVKSSTKCYPWDTILLYLEKQQ